MTKDGPQTRKIGSRRVRTEPVAGQGEEPAGDAEDTPGENDERLKADKPPHY